MTAAALMVVEGGGRGDSTATGAAVSDGPSEGAAAVALPVCKKIRN